MATTDTNTDNSIAATDYTGRPVAYFRVSGFEKRNRRFLFTMSNKTGLTFIMDSMDTQYGIIEMPWRELGVGNANGSSQLRIRGYKVNTLRGVSCSLRFRIHNEKGEDTKWRLMIFLEIGMAVDNSFGWYIDLEDKLLTAKQWYKEHPPEKQSKSRANQRNLVIGNTGRMQANLVEENLNIEMFTDNLENSSPSMIIKYM